VSSSGISALPGAAADAIASRLSAWHPDGVALSNFGATPKQAKLWSEKHGATIEAVVPESRTAGPHAVRRGNGGRT